MRLTSAKHKQYQTFPPDRRHKGNQSNVEEKRETLEQGWGTFYACMAVFEIMFNHMAAK